MPETVQLADFVTLKRGYDLPGPSRRPGEVPILGSFGITGSHDTPKSSGPGVTIGRSGASIGVATFVAGPYWPLNTTLYVSDFRGNDPRFVYYVLDAIDFAAYNSGSAQPSLNRNYLASIPVVRPSLADQRKIVAVLSAYDDLIENNNRRIALLEQMAQAIYREWFIEFRFPGHECVPLLESEHGSIPQGWEWTTLGQAAKWFSGGTPSTKVADFWNGDIPWITGGCLTTFQLDRSDRTITEAGLAAGSRLLPRDAVLLVVRGMSLANEFRMGIADVPLAFGQDCKGLVARSIHPLLLAHAIRARTDDILEMVQYAAHGTGVLPTDRLQGIPIAHPTDDVQERFVRVTSPMRDLTSRLRVAVDHLRASRDLLSPRLISGDLDPSELRIDTGDAA